MSYKKNVWVQVGTNIIGQSVSYVPLKLYRDLGGGESEEVTENHVLDVLEDVNPFDSNQTDFKMETVVDFHVYGKVFWYLETFTDNPNADPQEIYRISPQRVTVVPDKTGKTFIKEYKVNMGIGQPDWIIPPHKMVYFRRHDPSDPYNGLSALENLKPAIESTLSADEFNRQTFNHGGPRAFISFKETLDNEQREEVNQFIKENMEGRENMHRIRFLDGGASLVETSLRPKDMDFKETKATAKEMIPTVASP